MKKIVLVSMGALLTAMPAMATPSHTSNSFPNDEFMQEDYTYTGQANYTNMGVYSGSVTANASYNDCPANSWCDNSGQHACSSLTGGFNTSAPGSTANTDCYKACTVANANIAHATAVTGNDYYGAGTDTCEPIICEQGYHVNPGIPNLMTLIDPFEEAVTGGWRSNSGTGANYNESMYGITENGRFVVDFGNKGKISGRTQCSSQVGDDNDSSYTNPTVSASLPDATGDNCYCSLDGYASSGGSFQTFTTSWVFYDHADCDDLCAMHCFYALQGDGSTNGYERFRNTLFGLVTPEPASCEANTINITWNDASAADIEANDAGTATYGGDIRTPRAATIKPGKVFVGWKFSKPSGN